jgi:hypothetical protein
MHGKEIVNSADQVSTSSTFRERADSGSLRDKVEKNHPDINLNQIITSCPKDFLPVLADRLKEIRFKYRANERELALVADALISNLRSYVDKDVRKPMTADEAITEVRLFLAQQESETSH